MNIWLPALACVALIIYLLLQRTSGSEDKSAERLALLVGARRAWGETDASLRSPRSPGGRASGGAADEGGSMFAACARSALSYGCPPISIRNASHAFSSLTLRSARPSVPADRSSSKWRFSSE